jgi:hypothetical protein
MTNREWVALGMSSAKFLGGVTIAFFFLVIVMVATAQQDVLTRMKVEGLSLGYSSALTLRQEAKDKA